MAGFLTHYLFGMETCEKLPDDYIKNVIYENNHAFLTGLQGFGIMSFDPRRKGIKGLSYLSSGNVRSQEYGAFFNNMMDYIESLQGRSQSVCIAFMAGFLCYYVMDQVSEPYIHYFSAENAPAKSRIRDRRMKICEVETAIDTILFRKHCHMEPSQLNFDALTYVGKRDMADITKLMRYCISTTFHRRISPAEVSGGLRSLRRQIVCLKPKSGFRKKWIGSVGKTLPLPIKKVYLDFQLDTNDYMNTEGRAWYPYLGCQGALHSDFESLFKDALIDSMRLLEDLDSCLSWGMGRDPLIDDVMEFIPYV